MALFKYLLPYAICIVALMYFQSDFVCAAEKCIQCNNEKKDNLDKKSKYCEADEFEEETNAHTYCQTTDKSGKCGGFSFSKDDKSNVTRGCNIDCDSLQKDLKDVSKFVCLTCDKDNCNNFNLTFSNSSSTQIGYSIAPLVFSIVLAMYSN